MENTEFSLDLNCIKALPFDKYDHNFTFIVNGKQYKTNRIVADLISPIIRNYHYNDPTINEYSINTNTQTNSDSNTSEENDYFEDFLKLCSLNQMKIDETRKKHFCQYFLQLGNINEYLNLQPELINQLTSENIIEHLSVVFENAKISKEKSKETEISFYCDNYNKLIEFASSHFHEIDKEKMKNLDKNIIEMIISNEKLRIEEEDELLQFIIDMYESKHDFYNFFEYVEFKNVNEKTLEEFIEKFSINDLTLGTWKSICRRLLPSRNSKNYMNRYKGKIIEKHHIKGQEFKGIFKYLSEESGGNIHDQGIVEITSNSVYTDSYPPKNVVNYQENNHYETSAKTENAKLCFDFKNNKIQMTNYTIKTSGRDLHLKNWVIEASNDGKNWEIIDEHVEDSALNKNNAIVTFDIQKSSDFYRFIQIRQTGKSWNGDFHFVIYNIEFYGKLMIQLQKSM